MDEDGYKDEKKSKELKRLFRPDRNNEITMLAFVQSCDSIYKRLRFFRASVGNSSVIDKVMEDMLDILFNSALGMVLLTMLGFNPYPLLVTISSILVSFAFAFGASASMYMEVRQAGGCFWCVAPCTHDTFFHCTGHLHDRYSASI